MRDEHQESIGRMIAHLREQQGWSQRALARWVGLDQAAVSRMEAGRRGVSAKELQRFADAFHVSADALLLGLPGDDAPAPSPLPTRATPVPAPERRVERLMASLAPHAFSKAYDLSLGEAAAFEDTGGPEGAEPAHGDVGALPAANLVAESALRSELSSPSLEPVARARPQPADWQIKQAGHDASRPAASLPRLDGLPPEVAAVVSDWFELRRLAGGDEPALAWSTGHSAEGKPERFAHPVQPAERGSLGGDVLYDRVARFWRSELHVEPDDGPLPDLVPLLEDGLGAQVIVARVAGLEAAAAPASAERPVCAGLTVGGVPFIFVNPARPVVLQRFALAHALAHLVLGHGDVVDARIEWSRNNPREAAANDFAEEFLAPVRAVHRWYERRGEPRPEVETLLELGNAFGISAWAALYRSRAARRINVRQFAILNHELRRVEWELLPWQAFLGGLRDTLTHLTPGESLPQGEYGPPAVLRVPASMRAWALAAVRGGRLSVERAAAYLHLDPSNFHDRLTGMPGFIEPVGDELHATRAESSEPARPWESRREERSTLTRRVSPTDTTESGERPRPFVNRPPSIEPDAWEALRRRARSVIWEQGQAGDDIHYGELATKLDLHWFSGDFFAVLDALCLDEVAAGGPMVTVLVTNKKTRMPGERFFVLAERLGRHVTSLREFVEAERQRVIEWIRAHPERG